MRREGGAGERGRVEGDRGFQRRREGAYGTEGVCARCLDPSKECSARALSDAGDAQEKLARVLALESRQYKEGRGMERGWKGDEKAVDAVEGSRVAHGS